jgi:hypothetical protein
MSFGAKILLLCALALASAAPVPAGDPAGLELLPSQTRVGMVKVKLLVSDLVFRDEGMIGNYEILIPLAPWRNDRGQLRLDLDRPLDRVMAEGGTVTGSGLSLENGRVHPITCRFATDGSVDITVRTHERTLAFKSRMKSGS